MLSRIELQNIIKNSLGCDVTLAIYALEEEHFKVQTDADNDWHFKNNPYHHLPSAKSVIVITVPYALHVQRIKKGQARVASIGINDDYHQVLAKALTDLANIIEQSEGAFDYKIFVDKHGLDDKKMATLSGMGYVAKNQLLMTNNGTVINIGYLLTSLDIPTSRAGVDLNACESCSKCVDACPTGALDSGRLNLEKCRAFINQKKGVLNMREVISMGDWLYGCDICQYACPKNKVEICKRPPLIVKDFLTISKATFKRDYADRSYSYLGLTILRRNAMIVLYNQFGVEALKPYEDVFKRSPMLWQQYCLLKSENKDDTSIE